MSEVARRWKRGEVHPETGLVFWCYTCRSAEWWVSAEKFAQKKQAAKQYNSLPHVREKQREAAAIYAQTDAAIAKRRIRARRRRQKNADKERERDRLRYGKRRERLLATDRERRQRINADPAAKARLVKYWTEYGRMRRASDPLFRCRRNVRRRIHAALLRRNWKKTSSLTQMLGCTPGELQAHIQAKFQPGMTWENYGEWHVDHIIPLKSATSAQQIEALNHFSNLQPLWALDNLSKNARV